MALELDAKAAGVGELPGQCAQVRTGLRKRLGRHLRANAVHHLDTSCDVTITLNTNKDEVGGQAAAAMLVG